MIVRFDPEALHQAVYVYGLDGRYLGEAALWADAGFGDVSGAKRTAKLVGDSKQAAKALVEAHRRLSAAEVAEQQRAIGGAAAALPEPSVIRPVRHRGQTAAALKLLPEAAPQSDVQADKRPRRSSVFDAAPHLRAVE